VAQRPPAFSDTGGRGVNIKADLYLIGKTDRLFPSSYSEPWMEL
jgi:hypothetical protein